MKQVIFDQNNNLWYELHGDCYLPCLTVNETEALPIGIWGQRHLSYLKKHHPALHTPLLLSSKFNSYLADIDNQATEMFDRLVKQLAEKYGITEHLKAQAPMTWVQCMNDIRNAASEIVLRELIYGRV